MFETQLDEISLLVQKEEVKCGFSCRQKSAETFMMSTRALDYPHRERKQIRNRPSTIERSEVSELRALVQELDAAAATDSGRGAAAPAARLADLLAEDAEPGAPMPMRFSTAQFESN